MKIDIRVAMAISLTVIILRWVTEQIDWKLKITKIIINPGISLSVTTGITLIICCFWSQCPLYDTCAGFNFSLSLISCTGSCFTPMRIYYTCICMCSNLLFKQNWFPILLVVDIPIFSIRESTFDYNNAWQRWLQENINAAVWGFPWLRHRPTDRQWKTRSKVKI